MGLVKSKGKYSDTFMPELSVKSTMEDPISLGEDVEA